MKSHCSLAALACLIVQGLAVAAGFDDPGADRDALPKVPPGFEVSFFAREPLVRQPCSMAFDARGRLCVGMGPQYRNPTAETPGDSVVLVLDDDGDGRADRTRVFATGFNAIQGLAWHGRDLWVANAPDLTLVRDLDGDDEADEYVRVYTDLGNLEHGLHGLNWAPDGKLYLSKGNSKGLTQPGRVAPKPFRDLWGVTAPDGTPDFPEPRVFPKGTYSKAYHDPADDWGREGGVLRCDDGGANLEIVSRGFRNPWDITFDSGFHWLGTDNDQTTGDRVFMPFFGAHFGWNHPWSAHWGTEAHPPSAPVSGPLFEGSGTGVVFGDSPEFPPSHRGVFFINDWLRKTTFVWRPRWDGALLRPEGGDWEPFVEGGPALFRPTDLDVGPDGALWILGWSAGYGAEYRNGAMSSEGRVFRVAARGGPRALRPAPMRALHLAAWSVAHLVEDFDGPLPVWRIDAQDELVRRGAAVKSELLERLRGPTGSQARETWLAWTLGRLPISERDIDDAFAATLVDPKATLNLRIQALRIIAHRARRAGDGRPLPASATSALRDPEARIRFEAVQAIGQARARSSVPALLEAIARESDPTTRYAAWQTLRRLQDATTLKSLLADPRAGVRRAALLALLEDHALREAEIHPLTADADPEVRELVALWLRKASDGGEKTVVRGRPLASAETANPIENPRGGLARNIQAKPLPLPLAAPATPPTIDAVLALLDQGDRARGEWLFHARGGAGCFQCHRLDDHGNAFGPELATLGARATARHVVQSVLEPNAVITEGFHLHRVETADTEYSGVLLEESGLRLTLGLANGERQVIPKSAIRARATAATSAMPAFDNALSAPHVADLVTYLLAQKVPPKKSDVVPALPARAAVDPAATTNLWPVGDGFRVAEHPDRLRIAHSGRPVAEFVFRDEKILRPYFANIHAPGGPVATRHHPPVAGKDALDHDTMHPGLWLAFGDLQGSDFWRNKGRIEHLRFTEAPAIRNGTLHFATECRLTAPDGRVLASLTNRFRLEALDSAWLLAWDATFRSDDGDLAFGDQEEMGFGARVATPLTEKNGGVLVSSRGLSTARATWGQPAEWCDYSGILDGRRVGITLFAHPGNFRPSWWHNRDYGVFVANPFGRASMKQGAPSSVTAKRGEPFRLRFAAAIHAGDGYVPDATFRRYVGAGASEGSRARVPLLGWHSIPEKELTPERFRELAAMGLTHSLAYYSPAGNRKALDLAAQVGVRLFLEDERFAKPGEALEQAVREYRSHPALAGYSLRDEPSLGAFPELAAARNALHAADPTHPSYVNLLPTYASAAQLGIDSYPLHVRRFLLEFRPEVLSFDHYPILEGDRLRGDFYQNLEWIRHASIEFGTPFWAFALTCPHRPYPMPNLGHVRLQAWSNFAYGARGLQYFTYWTPNPGTWDFHDAPIRLDGSRSPTYDLLRDFNRDVQACADILLTSRVVSVHHTAPLPTGTRGLDAACPFRSIEGGEALVGLHLLPDGRRHALVVNRSFTRSATLKLVPQDWVRGLAWDHPVQGARFTPAREGAPAILDLEPGAAAFLRVD